MKISFTKTALFMTWCLCLIPINFINVQAQKLPERETLEERLRERERQKAQKKQGGNNAVGEAIKLARKAFSDAYTQCEADTYVTVSFLQGEKRGRELYDPVINFIEFDEVQGFTKTTEDIKFISNNGQQGAYIRFQIRASSLKRLAFRSKTVATDTTTRYTFDYEGKPDWSDWTPRAQGQYLLMDLILVSRLPYTENVWEVGKLDFRTDFKERIWNRPGDKFEKWELRAPTCQEVKERRPSFNQ